MELGELKRLNSVRDQWRSEASDFTPWLANNIEELTKAIGLELEVENIEVAAGPYSADILAKDTGTDEYVVIENQLEKTNHDHLGKALTYAAVLDASTIIWIATDFTEEHKKTLDWLNDHTPDEISFYGIQLELWQIDNSTPAVRLNTISRPNEAVKQAAKSKHADELSDAQRFQLEFWTKFRGRLEKTNEFPSLQTPRPKHWFDISLGKSNIHLAPTCNTGDRILRIRVYISNRIAGEMLPYLEGRKAEIEESIGQTLQWDPYPNSKDKTIVLEHPANFDDERQIDEALDWMVEYTVKFRKTFAKIIKEYREGKTQTTDDNYDVEARRSHWNSDFIDWDDAIEKTGVTVDKDGDVESESGGKY